MSVSATILLFRICKDVAQNLPKSIIWQEKRTNLTYCDGFKDLNFGAFLVDVKIYLSYSYILLLLSINLLTKKGL